MIGKNNIESSTRTQIKSINSRIRSISKKKNQENKCITLLKAAIDLRENSINFWKYAKTLSDNKGIKLRKHMKDPLTGIEVTNIDEECLIWQNCFGSSSS